MKVGDLVMVTGSYKEENIGKLAIVLKLGDSRMNNPQIYISIPATGKCLWCWEAWVQVWDEVYHGRW